MHTVLAHSPGNIALYIMAIGENGISLPLPISNPIPDTPETRLAMNMQACHLNGGLPPAAQRVLHGIGEVLEVEGGFLLQQLAKAIQKTIEEEKANG